MFGDAPNGVTYAGLGLTGAGLVVGPSLGQWSLGGSCALQSILPTMLRAGGVAYISWRVAAFDPEGFDALVEPPFLLLPGLVAVIMGAGWSIALTPRIRVDGDHSASSQRGAAEVSLRPAVAPSGAGSGVRILLQF